MTEWEQAQNWERDWWGTCCNTYEEERKQMTYMDRMGMKYTGYRGMQPVWDFMGKRVLDVGGGPSSVLLKSINLAKGVVVDPCDYPDWVTQRYAMLGIELHKLRGEDMSYEPGAFDVGIMYNCLQHVDDPEAVICNMRRCCTLLRVYEWIDVPVSPGHIHELKEDKLNEWLGGKGFTEPIFDTLAYYGVFVGEGVK